MTAVWQRSGVGMAGALGNDLWISVSFQRGPFGQLPQRAAAPMVPSRVTITRGRQAFDELPGPATVSVVCAGRVPQPGDRTDVIVLDSQGVYQGLFFGEVVSAALAAGPSVVQAPPGFELGGVTLATTSPVMSVQAVDQVARVWRRSAGGDLWPQEDPSIRVARILQEANTGLPAGGFSSTYSGELEVLETGEVGTAGEMLDDLMRDTMGIVRLKRGVVWEYIPQNRREGVGITATIPASVIEGPVSWSADDGDKVTWARVGWGSSEPQEVVEVRNERAEIFGSLGSSIDPRLVEVGTSLATQAAAEELALDLVGHRSLPLWRLSPITIDMRRLIELDPAAFDALVTMETESVVEVAGLPVPPRVEVPGPAVTGRLWVVGIRHDIDGPNWSMTLNVEPYERLAAPSIWSSLAPALTWEQVPSWVTWVTSRSWHPFQPTGTWSRLPADARWNGDLVAGVIWSGASADPDLYPVS